MKKRQPKNIVLHKAIKFDRIGKRSSTLPAGNYATSSDTSKNSELVMLRTDGTTMFLPKTLID